jgi:phospholipid transport system substrate-binding protein
MRQPTALLSLICACAPLAAAPQSAAPAAAAPAPAAAAAAAAAPATSGDPSALVQEAAQGMLGDIAKNRDAYRRDPAKIGPVVDKYLMPHFDTETSARVVLGQYWRSATPDQRQRFINAFYHSLLANYGDALIDFTPDRLKIFPSRVAPGDTTATVRTEVTRANGDRVSVNYSLRLTPQGWKAWDVVIDGISYVKSYREDFGSQIQQQGLDTVIKRLESGEKPGQIAKQTSSG